MSSRDLFSCSNFVHSSSTMHDSIHPASHYGSPLTTQSNVSVMPPRADSSDSVFPYKGIEQDALISWLISPRTDSCNSDTSVGETETAPLHTPEPFYPQLAKRSYAEKQYTPLPIQDTWSTNAGSLSFTFVFLLVGIALSAYIRYRFWRYYTEYAKLLFHPRTLRRVNEVEGPHIAQFHFVTDLTNVFSISVIAWRGLELFLPELYTTAFPKPLLLLLIFVSLLFYYFFRYLILRFSSYLIDQTVTTQVIWRQYFFIHRLLWPYYLALALLATFSTALLATFFIYTGLVLIIVSTLYAQFRTLLTFICFHYNLFYYFLYLCVLGIAPWLGLIRWLQLVR